MSNDEQHRVQTEDRVRYTQLIIQSPARNKAIVAGPGTGKSFMDVATAEVKPGDSHFYVNKIRSTSPSEIWSFVRSYSFVVRGDSWFAIICAFSSEPLFKRYAVMPVLLTRRRKLSRSPNSRQEIIRWRRNPKYSAAPVDGRHSGDQLKNGVGSPILRLERR
jgi:hypothetical protein